MTVVNLFTNPWESGTIRGRQIAEKLGERGITAFVDPTMVDNDDTCIGIKCCLPEPIVQRPGRTIIDITDAGGILPWIKTHPSVELMAISESARERLRSEFPTHKIWLIPEHHCNFEETVVVVKHPITAGYTGSQEGLQLNPDDISRDIAPTGLKFVAVSGMRTREEVCSFYRCIDLQICFRRDQPHPELKNPLKVINAGSFRIPTIAFPEVSYKELDDSYIHARTLDDIAYHCHQLVEHIDLYHAMAEKALETSRLYSIKRTVDRYCGMLNGTSDSV
jgi:hypothetical protein